MLDFDSARDAVTRELGATAARAATLSGDDLARPTRCPGWDLHALLAHIAGGAAMYAEIARRMARGDADRVDAAMLSVALPRSPQAVSEALATRHRELGAALAALPAAAAGAPFPHPWLSVDGRVGVNIMVFEEGMHRSDLLSALDEAAELPADVAGVAMAIAAARLPDWAQRGDPPDVPVTFVLSDGTTRITVAWNGTAWAQGGRDSADIVRITADPSTLTLFACGRIAGDHPGLSVDGDPRHAARFKAYFPGP